MLGSSYSLQTRRAAVQRAVNYMLRPIEPGNEKGGFYLQQVPGLVRKASIGAEIRGMLVARGRLFVVAGGALYEVSNRFVPTRLGSVVSRSGPVSMVAGLNQLCIVDGDRGYLFNLNTNTFSQITDTDFEGASVVQYVDGFFVFVRPDSQQWYISDIDDANDIDALDFVSAEAYPDNLVSCVVTQRELWMMGAQSIEVWSNIGGSAFPFARISGAIVEIGCMAPFACTQIDNTVMWLGRDKHGSGMVYRAEGYRPVRVSTYAVEEALKQSTDLENAVAYAYQQNGQTFWALNAPGLSSTWVYDLSAGQWHERCDLSAGELIPHRATHHAFAHGFNLVGDASGYLYSLDFDTYTNDGDVLYRERTTPHQATPARNRIFFSEFRLDVEVGKTPQGEQPLIELRWSDDGGETWGAWLARSLGRVGEYTTRVNWPRPGAARDRVWQIRTTSNARASIVGAAVRADEGV